MASKQLFDGQPVLEFTREADRRNFLRWAGIVGVGATFAAGGAGAWTILGARDASAQAEQSDIDILNYALTLEFLEAEFYQRGIDAGILSGRELELVQPIREHEAAHVSAISATIQKLGAKPVDKPRFRFPEGTFEQKMKFLGTARTFEELGVTAYHGQVGNIKSLEILAAAAAIAGVESRHAAILEDLTAGEPFPAPFEASKTMEQVREEVKPFIES